MATGSATPHRALLEECETTSDPFEFEGLWILDVEGTPSALLANKVELQALEDAIQTVFACNQEEVFYSLTNVTVRLDLLQDIGTTSRTFSLPISIDGQSNLVGLLDTTFFEDRRQLVEDPELYLRTRNLQAEACACLPLTAEVFLTKLSEKIVVNNLTTIKECVGILKTEERECKSDVTSFSSGISVEVVGNVDLVGPEAVTIFVDSLLVSWNTANLLSESHWCDKLFKRLTIGSAFVDPASIRRGEGRRTLQDNRVLQGGSTSEAAEPPSASSSPTQAPTTRGPDLFTLLIQVEGVCRGCLEDSNLFDYTEEVDRKLPAIEDTIRLQRRSLSFAQGCFCAIGAKNGGVGRDEFFQIWTNEWAVRMTTGVDSFAAELASISEVEASDCAPNLTQFVSLAASRFSGYPSLLTEEEIGEVEDAFLASFNKRAEQVCDPFIRKLAGVQAVRVVVETEMPTLAPSSSSIPSDLPSPLRTLCWLPMRCHHW
jgi:hypothetical protein